MWLSHGLFLQIYRVNLSNCQGPKIFFVLYFEFEWLVLAHKFAHWSNIACLPAGRINTQRHLMEAENTISNCENCIYKYVLPPGVTVYHPHLILCILLCMFASILTWPAGPMALICGSEGNPITQPVTVDTHRNMHTVWKWATQHKLMRHLVDTMLPSSGYNAIM